MTSSAAGRSEGGTVTRRAFAVRRSMYLMLSSTLQPELSAVLVGIKSPREVVRQSRARLAHMLSDLR